MSMFQMILSWEYKSIEIKIFLIATPIWYIINYSLQMKSTFKYILSIRFQTILTWYFYLNVDFAC